jgi:hypothetical protein
VRHRQVRLPSGQDAAEALGRVLWTQRRPNGDELVLRGHIQPRPHVALEVWRGGQARVVRLSLAELGSVATALLKAPRALAGRKGTS